MSIALLHRVSNALIVLVSVNLLVVSFGSYADSDILADNDYLLDQHEINQRTLNVMWLEQGMEEVPSYHESNEALHELTQGVLKKYWAAVVSNNRSYDRYTPIVNGHFSSSSNETNYDFRLTSNIIKFSIDYSF